MGFDLDVTIPAFTVFIQGLLSFLSPCVLPLVPLYISYLSAGTAKKDSEGVLQYDRKTILINTLFFVLGISFSFFLLGLGFTALGQFFNDSQILISRIGGVLIIMFGLFQLGLFGSAGVGKEHRLPIKINTMAINPITALIMGFTFSFAWTPCVGPALSTVLIMASSANSMHLGFMLIGVYTLGFVLPFMALGFFTTSLLNLFKKYRNVVAYTVKIGGALMIVIGIMMLTGWMNGITGYLSTLGTSWSPVDDTTSSSVNSTPNSSSTTVDEETTPAEEENTDATPAIDFTLTDQFGNTHTLSDYKGKTVFLNFWATWCPPCREEMPDIQTLYENYGLNEEDVIILGIASPSSDDNPHTSEQDTDGVIAFLDENNFTYPVVLDPSGEIERAYGISALPTTFMIDENGDIFGYLPGMMTYEIMESIIAQTQDSMQS